MASSPPTHLRRSLGFTGVLSQSLAGIAPTATPTINIAIIFTTAGTGTWLTYLVATLAVLSIALNLNVFARSTASAGSLSDFVSLGLGQRGQTVTAWALLLAYLSASVATLTACSGYMLSLLTAMAVQAPPVLLGIVIALVCCIFAFQEIQLSTKLMLILETLSVLMIIFLCIRILVREGLVIDLSQFTLKGVTATGFNEGLIVAMLSFAGFEAATTLGEEAKHPYQAIPRILFLTPVLAGGFFIFSAYVIVLGFNFYKIGVATSDAPLDTLAQAMGIGNFGLLISVGATVSLFGCGLATLVAASRLLFSMIRSQTLPQFNHGVQSENSQLKQAIVVCAVIVFVAVVLCLARFKPLDVYDWFGTFGTFGFLIAYGLSCIAAPIFLQRSRSLHRGHLLASAVGFLVISFIFLGSIVPLPTFPLNLAPLFFLILLGLGVTYSLLHPKNNRD
ncbi:APC family permease [Candidatus Synechococcus calcipolaris G9]|uniref:APC family permease n=1 Tax=Candidatus Synechococcus calcipolaris G9 TaxID=1497997 RepID=A0ABT6EZD2_9SYNE|nr:APC family permease [Candidatus Synechococcus calcipolaris]MDG2990938.1 APC family permease [Candidatus Synechococcus calcipolaris G9]